MAERYLLQLFEVAGAGGWVVVQPFELRQIPCPHRADLPSPSDRTMLQISQQPAKAWPGQCRRARRHKTGKLSEIETVLAEIGGCLLGDDRTDPGQQPQCAEAGDRVTRIFRPAQDRQQVLDMRCLDE